MQIDSLSSQPHLSVRRARLVIAIGVVLIVVGALLLLTRMQNVVVVGSDFTQDYVAGQALRQGRTIYAPFGQDDLTAEKLGTANPLLTPDGFANNHPPFDAVLFLPMTFLPYDVAIYLWSVFSVVLYCVTIWIILRELKIELATHWKVLLAGLALCWYPFQAHIALGQISLLVIVCLVWCWALLRRGRDLPAGVLLGIACLIKLFPGVIVVYLLLRRRWRAAGAAIATLAAGGLLTLAVVGVPDTIDFFRRVAPLNGLANAPVPINYALSGVFHRLFGDGLWVNPAVSAPWVVSPLATLCSLALTALLAFIVWRSPATLHADDTTFSLACLVMLLASPITWQHIFPLLLLPLALLALDLARRFDRRRLALTLVVLVILSLPDIEIGRALMGYYRPYRMEWFAGQVFLIPTFGLLLLGWLVVTRPTDDKVTR
jgi:hypothetical protein